MAAPRKQDQNKADPNKPDATITFTFESAYNQIVQPLSYVSLSQYFIAHWMPDITPAGLKILLQLRSMGYYNPKASVQRGDIDIDQKELAALCGMSHSTLKRAFGDDPILSAYVQRVFETKRDSRTGRIIKEHYVYVVKMDDVLTPVDKALLEDMLQGPDKQSPPAPLPPPCPMVHFDPSDMPPMGQNDPRGVQSEPPMGQNEPPMGQNEPPMGQNEPPMGQNDPSLKGIFITPNTLDTPNTPGAAPELSASLFEEQTPEPKRAPILTWKLLPETERKPWQEQARRELVAIHFGTGITPRPFLIEQRASNIYEASLGQQERIPAVPTIKIRDPRENLPKRQKRRD